MRRDGVRNKRNIIVIKRNENKMCGIFLQIATHSHTSKTNTVYCKASSIISSSSEILK